MFIKELELFTNDLTAAEAFYTKVLDFAVINKSETCISFRVGHSILCFTLTEEANPFYHFAFSIPSSKVNEAYEFVGNKTSILPFTADTSIADFSNWNAHAFYFHDHQNNIVEFIAHHDLPNSSNDPFAASSVIGICEIGIPVEDVTAACKALNEEYNVPYYIKGPKLEDFCVMGDEIGLFIVTTIGRGWLPTQQPAALHYSNIAFDDGNRKSNIVIGNTKETM